MKWTCRGNKRTDKTIWHKWFAWFPVCVKNHGTGHREMVWLEQIKRKGKHTGGSDNGWWGYEYKL